MICSLCSHRLFPFLVFVECFETERPRNFCRPMMETNLLAPAECDMLHHFLPFLFLAISVFSLHLCLARVA